jgi:hypothetical protein
MSGHQKFLAMGCLACRGKIGAEVTTRQIQEQWPNSQIAQKYNPVFYERAQQKGWVDPVLAKKGAFTVDQAGLDHLSALLRVDSEIVSADLQKSGGLVVVNRKATHTFDSICGRFSCAKSEILIADAWVDETIFDTVLDVIPRTVVIKLLYDRAQEPLLREFSVFRLNTHSSLASATATCTTDLWWITPALFWGLRSRTLLQTPRIGGAA